MGTVEAAEVVGEKRITVPSPPSIEDFIIVKPISRGAFGKVYLARKKVQDSKLFAVKVVKKADMINKNMVHQVQAERDALALSKSPFVVHLYYSLHSASNIYLVMEYLIGGDVKSLLHIYGYFDEEMAVKYISEVALALDYLHRHGIIHRDLKPDNMLISNEGHIKLTDFGLSRVTLKRELSMMDILTTPSMTKPKQDYSRTPGQVLSLISSLGFHTPVGGKMQPSILPLSPMCVDSTQGSFLVNPKENKFSSNKLMISSGPDTLYPCTPGKCLTPNPLQYRMRFGTSSTNSPSHFSLSSMETDCCSSPQRKRDVHEPESSLCCVKNCILENVIKRTQNSNEVKSMMKKDLESVLSPIGKNDSASEHTVEIVPIDLGDTPPAAPSLKGLARKCLYGNETWEEVLGLEKAGVVDDGEALHSYQPSPPWLSNPVKYTQEEENAEKVRVKRNYELVEKSPGQEITQGKKNNAEYKRGFEIADIQPNSGTGLTIEIESIMLCGIRECNGNSKSKEVDEKDANSASKTNQVVAKNLLCELDEHWEKKEKQNNPNSSFPSSDDIIVLERNLSMQSDSSSPDMSIIENHLEKQLSDLNKSIKELSFEESKSESREISSPAFKEIHSNDDVGRSDEHAILYCKSLHSEEQTALKLASEAHNKTWTSPTFEIVKMAAVFKKKNNVAFRSYNSPISLSNVSEPSMCSIGSSNKMDISPAYTGSYPMTVTPAQRNRYKGWQELVETPYRTPKSVRRGAAPVDGDQILGTPDYLAPELLLGKNHGPAVDWWALGVCLFEFLTGIPPFNDETPAQVFQNILKRDIPWPEGEEQLSISAQTAIESLLTVDNTRRAGLKDLKLHPLFHGIEWDNLQNQTMPFIPQPDDETDTTYFEARNNAQQLTVSGFSL